MLPFYHEGRRRRGAPPSRELTLGDFRALLNYQFAYIRESLGFYKLPATLRDLQKQMKRFLDSDKIHEQTFGLDFVKQFYTITPLIKLKALLKTFPKHPLSTIGYVMSWLPIKFAVMISRPSLNPTWDPVKSTK